MKSNLPSFEAKLESDSSSFAALFSKTRAIVRDGMGSNWRYQQPLVGCQTGIVLEGVPVFVVV